MFSTGLTCLLWKLHLFYLTTLTKNVCSCISLCLSLYVFSPTIAIRSVFKRYNLSFKNLSIFDSVEHITL